MNNREELLSELTSSKELLDIIVHNRKRKVLIRWILGAMFYSLFWHLAWLRNLFWIGLILELILLTVTIISFFRLRTKIHSIQRELEL